jgi:hypothetical protein
MGKDARYRRLHPMLRVVTFDNDERGKTRFQRLYQAMILAQIKEDRTLEIMRREASILDKLEAISVMVKGERVVEPDADLALTVQEHTLLASYILKVPWTTTASKSVVDAADFLEAADKVEEAN